MHGAQQHLWMHAYSLQKCIWTRIYTYIYIHIYMYIYICIHAYIDIYIYIYTYTYLYTWIHIYIHMRIHYIYIYIYTWICTYIYIFLHNSCMRAYATVQQLLCHGSYCELILSLARTSCRLSFPPALLPLRRAGRPPAGPLQDTVCLRNSSISTLAHDAVAAAVLHKHHSIIRVGAVLIQFVYGSHLRMAADLTLDKNLFSLPFSRVFVCVLFVVSPCLSLFSL